MSASLPDFDVQAHRGGAGLTTEGTLAAFEKALAIGVTTLEFDTNITRDGAVVVTHDRRVSAVKAVDTRPFSPDDLEFPYVGKLVKELTLAQLQTLDWGFQQLPGFPEQEVVAGASLAVLGDVFHLVDRLGADHVRFNIETKLEATARADTATPEEFTQRLFEEIERAGVRERCSVQSFDWLALELMHELAPEIGLVALTNYDFLQVGQRGASPWLGGIDVDDFGGDFVEAASSIEGLTVLSPNYGFPRGGVLGQPGFRFYATEALVAAAHERGLRVIPWTVDDPATMAALIDLGVDGLITNYPDRLRTVMAEKGLPLPPQCPPVGRPVGGGTPSLAD